MDRVSGTLVSGAVRYAADAELPGMLHAQVLRSPYAHARVVRVDATAVPDGLVVLTREDVRDLGAYGCQIQDETVLAVDRVRHVGDPVAAVAAPTPREAEEALAVIDVEYDELPAVFDPVQAAEEGAPLVHEVHRVSDNPAAYFDLRPQEGTNVCHRFRIRSGDVDAAFAQADEVVEETYRTAAAQHAAMEPHASLARWDGDRLEVWTGTQTPFNVRADLASVFGMPEANVRVVALSMGGAFGAKAFVRLERTARCSRSAPSAGSTPVRMPTAVRGSRRRSAIRSWARTGSPTSTSTRTASTPTCRQTAPSAATGRRRRSGPRSG
jgi:CO/xanthine dehydrogenase Mo-binding subunit